MGDDSREEKEEFVVQLDQVQAMKVKEWMTTGRPKPNMVIYVDVDNRRITVRIGGEVLRSRLMNVHCIKLNDEELVDRDEDDIEPEPDQAPMPPLICGAEVEDESEEDVQLAQGDNMEVSAYYERTDMTTDTSEYESSIESLESSSDHSLDSLSTSSE